jgi:hypothetical protein
MFIDEGYYYLTSFKLLENWIIFIPYVVAIYLISSGINTSYKFILKQVQNSK